MLYEVDDLAKRRRLSRSGFVQEATARYIAEIEAEEARRKRQTRVEAAMEKMRRAGKGTAAFDGTAQIRKDRQRDGK